MENFINFHSPISEISKLIEGLRGFSDAKKDLLAGNYESFIWWLFLFLLALIQLFLILSLFWILIKRILLEPNLFDKRTTKKLVIEIVFIAFIQIISGIPFLYPILSVNISIG